LLLRSWLWELPGRAKSLASSRPLLRSERSSPDRDLGSTGLTRLRHHPVAPL